MIYVIVALALVCAVSVGYSVMAHFKYRTIAQRNDVILGNLKLSEEKNLKLENDVDSLNSEIRALIEQNANLKTAIDYEKQMSQERLETYKELKEESKNEFKVLSQNILEERLKAHKESQEENLGQILKPLQAQIEVFQKQVQDVYDKENKGRSELFVEIKQLKTLNDRISQDAISLTNALKGSNKIQGNWGEVVLENLLQDSGLIEHREYETQRSFKDEQGRSLRPDVVIKLPNNKRIIIDSKVSLVDYERYVNAQNADDDAMLKHIISLKNHIKELSKKNYSELLQGAKLDFVLMFVPLEGAFLDAIRYDSELFSFAYDRNIILVSPTTLYATLRTIENIWRNERQSNNIEEILKSTSALYDKFALFYDRLRNLGERFRKIDDEYDELLKQLKDGKGSIISRIQGLETLGIKGKKKIAWDLGDSNNDAESGDSGVESSDNADSVDSTKERK